MSQKLQKIMFGSCYYGFLQFSSGLFFSLIFRDLFIKRLTMTFYIRPSEDNY